MVKCDSNYAYGIAVNRPVYYQKRLEENVLNISYAFCDQRLLFNFSVS